MAKRFGGHKVSNLEYDMLVSDIANASHTTVTVDTDKLCVFDDGGVSIGQLADPGDNNLEVAGNAQVTGSLIAGSLKDNNITAQSGTGAEDLTTTSTNLLWHAATTQAGNITLPQATEANAGMVITCMAGADWSGTEFKLGFADSGTTTMAGQISLGAIDGTESVDAFKITDGSKALQIDSNAANRAGGAVGSIYKFHYIGAGTVFCEALGMCTTGTPALVAGASSTTGTS